MTTRTRTRTRVPQASAEVKPKTNTRTRPRPEGTATNRTAQDEARDFYIENKRMNAAKKKAETARKALDKAMEVGKIKTFQMTITEDSGKEVQVEVTGPSEYDTDYVDVRKLYAEVDLDTFLSIVTASKGKVEETCGKPMMHKVLVTTKGTQMSTVKPVK